MLTVLNAIELSSDYLLKKSVKSPRINAELLLAHILNCSRMDLYLRFDQPLSESETKKYREAIRRRSKREPLQYITGSVEFYGLEFNINKNVLIPRQETEILVETVIHQVEASEELNILDIGTGSGNIAISLAKNLPNSKITSIDKNESSISVAKLNAEKNYLNGEIDFLTADFTQFDIKNDDKFDIIVSNPPYISLQDYSALEVELINFEPKDALTDFSDGFTFFKLISSKSKDILQKKGRLFFEVGQGQFLKVMEILRTNSFININVVNDYLGIERVVYGELK